MPFFVSGCYSSTGPFESAPRTENTGFQRVLRKALAGEDRTVPFGRSIFAMVGNRWLAPASKLFTYESWLREDVYFPEGQGIELHHLYRAMDFVARHKDRIMEPGVRQGEHVLCDLLWDEFLSTDTIHRVIRPGASGIARAEPVSPPS